MAGRAAEPPKPADQLLQEADESFKKGEWDAAEIVFLQAAQSPLVEERIQAYEKLTTLYKKVRLKKKARKAEIRLEAEKRFRDSLVPKDDSYYQSYKVRKEDSYAKIARKHKISEEWLKRVNENKNLAVGEMIKVPRYRDFLIVNKEKKKLIWKRGPEILKIYPISVGRQGSETPDGEYHIIEKVKDPAWYWMKEVIPPHSPKNLLGTRWLGLNHKGYGIHGTRTPRSIGTAASHGCIRMFNHDVEELFSWVPVGTKVVIGHETHNASAGAGKSMSV